MTRGTLFVHAGLYKTGSSAIQGFARDTPIAGLTYPATGQWPDGAHHILMQASGASSTMPDMAPVQAADVDAAFRAEVLASSGDMLISAEGLNPQTMQRFLSRYDDLFRTRFDRMIPVVVLRHPLERIASIYNQAIKEPHQNELRDPDVFLAESGPSHLSTRAVTNWQRAYPAVRFIGHNPAATLIERFFQLLGHPVSGVPAARPNRSISGVALIALLIARRLLPGQADRAAFFDRLRQDKSVKPWKGETFPFSPAATAAFAAAHVGRELAAIQDLTGVDLRSAESGTPRRFTLSDAERAHILRHVGTLPGFHDRAQEFLDLIARFAD